MKARNESHHIIVLHCITCIAKLCIALHSIAMHRIYGIIENVMSWIASMENLSPHWSWYENFSPGYIEPVLDTLNVPLSSERPFNTIFLCMAITMYISMDVTVEFRVSIEILEWGPTYFEFKPSLCV